MYGHYFIPSIRMQLNGFFETAIEDYVISEFKRLQVVYGNITFQFYENNLETIAKFVKKYEDIFLFKTKIYNDEVEDRDFSWFYIYEGEKKHGTYKFCCKTNVVVGLKEFDNTMKFVVTPNTNTKTTHRAQKRNDYEDSNWN